MKYSGMNNGWSHWVAAATRRLGLQSCDGKAVEIASRQWLQLRCPIKDFMFCETLDKIGLTALEDGFEFLSQKRQNRSAHNS